MSDFNFSVDPSNHPAPTSKQLYDVFVNTSKGNIDEFAFPLVITTHAVTYITAKKIGDAIGFGTSILKFPIDGDMSEDMIRTIGRINFTARTLSVPGIPNEEQ